MGFYRERIFPRLCHAALKRPEVARLRQELLAPLAGEVIEIGFGTGLNLPHYPAAVSRLTAVEPNRGMVLLIDVPLVPGTRPFLLEVAEAEALPFPDASFDAAVSTFTLCSIADIAAVCSGPEASSPSSSTAWRRSRASPAGSGGLPRSSAASATDAGSTGRSTR